MRLSASDAVTYLSPQIYEWYFGDASGFMPVMEEVRDFVLMVRDCLVKMAICGDLNLVSILG